MIQNPVPWPNGAKVAVAISLDMDADSLLHLEHPKDSRTRVSTLSMLRYGPQVAIPRILDTYRRFELKQTFFIPAWCIEQYPQTVDAIVKDGHEDLRRVDAFLAKQLTHHCSSVIVAVIQEQSPANRTAFHHPVQQFALVSVSRVIS